MEGDGLERKVSRRTMLKAGIGGVSSALLAACGAAPTATTAPTEDVAVAPTTAPEPTTVPEPAVEPTMAPEVTAAQEMTMAPEATTAAVETVAPTVEPTVTPTPLPLPEGTAGKITILQRQEYFEAVQTKWRDTVTAFVQSQGGELEVSTANPELFGDFTAKIAAAVQAGNPPDMAYHTVDVQQLHFLDTLEDVTDVVEEAVRLYGDIVPVTAAKNAMIDGRWWSVPFMSNSGAWFARRDIFEAAGIDVMTLDTYDKRRDAALEVSDPAKEIWGWGLTINRSGDGHGVIMGVIQAFGGSITDESGEKVVFNSPETVAAVKWLQETYTSEKYRPMLPPGIESWTDPTNNENYLAGKVALTSNAFSVYAQAKRDQNPVFGNTAVLRAPTTNAGEVLEAGGNGWFSLFRGAKNVELAKQVMLHLLAPENFIPMAQEGGGLFLPAYKNLWTEEILSIDPNFETLQEIIFNETPFTGFAWPADPNPAIAAVTAEAIQSEMMANVTSGNMTAEQAVEEAHNRIVRIFEELGLPQG